MKPQNFKQGIVYSTVLNILSKLIGFVNIIIITKAFGLKIDTDIYYYIVSVVTLVCSLVSGIDMYILIPEAIRLRNQPEDTTKKTSQKFLNAFIHLYVVIGLIVLGAGSFFPTDFYSFFSKFEAQQLIANKNLLCIGSGLVLLQLLNGIFASILTSYKYFTVSIIGALINSLFTFLATILFYEKLGIKGTLIGLYIGQIINLSFFVYLFIVKLKWNFLDVNYNISKKILTDIAMIEFNILPVWVRNYIVLYLVSGLGVGFISSLNIANTIAAIPENFILTQVASIFSIKLAELNANKNYEEAKRVFYGFYKTLLFVIVPICICAMLSSDEVINIFFARGKFNTTNSITVAKCLFFLLLVLPSKILDVLYSRLFTSFQAVKSSVKYGIIGHTIFTIITFILIKNLKINGYFLSINLGGYIIMPIVFYAVLKSNLIEFLDRRVVLISFQLFIISVITYFLSSQISQYIVIDNLVLKVFLKTLLVLALYLIFFIVVFGKRHLGELFSVLK